MFGKSNKKNKVSDSIEDIESDIDPEDILDDSIGEEPIEEEITSAPLPKAKPLKKPQKPTPQEEGITEEEVLRVLQDHESKIVSNEEMTQIIFQRLGMIDERLKAVESAIFRIKSV